MEAVIDWRYIRMSVTARQKLAEAIRQKRRECYNGARVRYTSTTVNLLSAILERIDRQTGKARIAFSVLMNDTGIANRGTVSRHVFLLEKAGCIAVKRVRVERNRNAINEFRLIGETALAFLGEKWSPTVVKNRTDIYRYDNRTDINKINDDDNDIDPIKEDLLGKIQTVLDDGIGEKMINRHGVEMVKAWYEWVMSKPWSTNPGGLLVIKLATGKMPPVENQKQGQGRKSKPRQMTDEERAQAEAEELQVMRERIQQREEEEAVIASMELPEWVTTLRGHLKEQCGFDVSIEARYLRRDFIDIKLGYGAYAVWGYSAVDKWVHTHAEVYGVSTGDYMIDKPQRHEKGMGWIDDFNLVKRFRVQVQKIGGRLALVYNPLNIRGYAVDELKWALIDMWRSKWGIEVELVAEQKESAVA